MHYPKGEQHVVHCLCPWTDLRSINNGAVYVTIIDAAEIRPWASSVHDVLFTISKNSPSRLNSDIKYHNVFVSLRSTSLSLSLFWRVLNVPLWNNIIGFPVKWLAQNTRRTYFQVKAVMSRQVSQKEAWPLRCEWKISFKWKVINLAISCGFLENARRAFQIFLGRPSEGQRCEEAAMH